MEEDKVIAEFDVVANQVPNFDFYLLQYLHRPSMREYGDQVN